MVLRLLVWLHLHELRYEEILATKGGCIMSLLQLLLVELLVRRAVESQWQFTLRGHRRGRDSHNLAWIEQYVWWLLTRHVLVRWNSEALEPGWVAEYLSQVEHLLVRNDTLVFDPL